MIKYTCGAGTPEEAEANCTYFIRGECTASFCEYRRKKRTNADRIRAMSDEEIPEYVCRNSINTLCDIICGGECNAIATLKKSGDWACKEIVMKWLQQPVEEDDHDERKENENV